MALASESAAAEHRRELAAARRDAAQAATQHKSAAASLHSTLDWHKAEVRGNRARRLSRCPFSMQEPEHLTTVHVLCWLRVACARAPCPSGGVLQAGMPALGASHAGPLQSGTGTARVLCCRAAEPVPAGAGARGGRARPRARGRPAVRTLLARVASGQPGQAAQQTPGGARGGSMRCKMQCVCLSDAVSTCRTYILGHRSWLGCARAHASQLQH